MAWRPSHRSPEQSEVLAAALARAEEAGPGALAIFDLDGCLLDNRARQVHILREFAAQHDVPEIYAVRDEHFVDWNLKNTLALAGVPEARTQRFYPLLHEHWWRCFFSDEYLVFDHAMPGAVGVVKAVRALGLKVMYLTARYENVRDGSWACLQRWGFPTEGEGISLVMKGDPDLDDDVAKVDAVARLHASGPVLFFDNEPANVNSMRRRFPEAMIVFVETDHSPRPIEAHPALPRVRGFLR